MILSDCDIAQGKRMVDQLIHEIAAYRFYWQGAVSYWRQRGPDPSVAPQRPRR
ncbi:hypothetical protein N4G58_19000 [Edwardsiella piscicida]|nr:hypothetical protein N4G58_19000 [Edwardsiella piscicida]